jgi:hypothetical protein
VKLARIAHYDRGERTDPAMRLRRFDVVDVNAFLSAYVAVPDALFEDGTEAPLVEVIFSKGGTCHLVSTSASEFRRVMGFDPPGTP